MLCAPPAEVPFGAATAATGLASVSITQIASISRCSARPPASAQTRPSGDAAPPAPRLSTLRSRLCHRAAGGSARARARHAMPVLRAPACAAREKVTRSACGFLSRRARSYDAENSLDDDVLRERLRALPDVRTSRCPRLILWRRRHRVSSVVSAGDSFTKPVPAHANAHGRAVCPNCREGAEWATSWST